jgi:hypothetical protein
MIKKEKDKLTKQLKDRENESDTFQSHETKSISKKNIRNDDKNEE